MARNQQNGQSGQNGSWNSNQRYTNSDDSVMRRGDDRTIESQSWGSQQSGMSPERNSYRNDDYPTDKDTSRSGEDRFSGSSMGQNHLGHNQSGQLGQSQQYGNRNNQTHGQHNYRQDQSNSYQGSGQNYGQTYGQSSGQNYGQSSNQGSSFGSAQTFSPDRNYGWSQDYRSSGDYGSSGGHSYGTQGQSSTWGSSNNQGLDRSYGRQDNMYGQGGDLSNSQRSYGQHSGKGPKNYRRSDDRIKEEISEALERDPHIDASELEIDVKEGVVSLRGHVEDRKTKRHAEDIIEGMYGVKDVRNELTVDQSVFTQARNAIFGESAESQSASSTNSNKSTATKSKH